MLFKYLFIAALALLVPGLASAATSTLNPLTGNSWDLYVFGNGRVIYDIMMGVKMLMVPDAGDSGFTLLLLLMATIGFIVLAVFAGFDPGKNLLKMFGYVFMVWMVTLFTTKIVVNVQVHDMVANSSGIQDTYVVEGVPAIVAMPSVLTSQVGQYFTKSLESYFSTPVEFKLTGGAVGQFNLFAKMVEESNEYGFTYAELKQTMSAYTADCVVPAMAMGQLTGPHGKDGTVTGVDALLRTTDLLKTYESAKHNSIMTTYYPVRSPELLQNGGSAAPAGTLGGMGVVMTCNDAYLRIKDDMAAHAAVMMGRGAEAWKKSGIMVPFETAFRSMIAQASAPGGSGAAGFSSPSGYILQQGFLNSMNGAFRTAAAQTGNNELLQAANLSQAEANQKSAWVAAFSTFNNMMGYVFTVLQAFIFAITPLIVVALLVPGLGAGIFKNYAQILIWLTLWMPAFALINFVITSFGSETYSGVLGMDGGLSMNSKGAFNEKTKNLVIAAQFLGTMVPMITWGIVKGAMAFTEFISHGVGSQFAASAGASAASGNLSLNNTSMDNFSANKYNTAMSSTVGFQATNAFANAGAMDVTQNLGGGSATMNGGSVSASKQMSEGLSQRISEQKSYQQTLSSVLENTASFADAMSKQARGESSTMSSEQFQMLSTLVKNATQGRSTGDKKDVGTVNNTADGVAASQSADAKFGAEAKAGLQVAGMGGGVSTSTTGTNGKSSNQTANQSNNASTGSSSGDSQGTGTAASEAKSAARASQESHSSSIAHMSSHDLQAALRHGASEAMAYSQAMTQNLEHMQSVTSSASFNNSVTASHVTSMMNDIDSLSRGMGSVEDLNSKFNAMASQHGASMAGARSAIAGARGQIGAGGRGSGGGSSVSADAAAVRSEVSNFSTQTGQVMDARTAAVDKQHGDTSRQSQNQRTNGRLPASAGGAFSKNIADKLK